MVVSLIAALVLAAPPGFFEAKRLEPAASYVAGKPVTILCAQDGAEWDVYLARTYGPGATNVGGATYVGSDLVRLSPNVCMYLNQQLRTPSRPNLAMFGPALQILVHESLHARGESDEGVTDCDAVHRVPGVAVRFFHIKAGKQLRAMMSQVWLYRRLGAKQLQTVC